MIADQQGALDNRQVRDGAFEQGRAVELPILQGFIKAGPLPVKDRRARQCGKGSQLRRREHGIEKFKERIAGTRQTTIKGLAESDELAKLRVGRRDGCVFHAAYHTAKRRFVQVANRRLPA
jgi:hypothetical protein